ncbi:hypothetical protein HDU98_002659 [Podochytrium sp. JEL0797]|nr:hypothetical protein HDU98_002659 [Podochytrium sp. JEL0797]
MNVRIPADLEEEYVEFMRPFIICKIGGEKETPETHCAGILAEGCVDFENALVTRHDSIDSAHTEAGNSSQKLSDPQESEVNEHEHGSVKKMRSSEIETLEGDEIGEPDEAGLYSNQSSVNSCQVSTNCQVNTRTLFTKEFVDSRPDSVDPVPAQVGNTSPKRYALQDSTDSDSNSYVYFSFLCFEFSRK